jgi:hypothetical protein
MGDSMFAETMAESLKLNWELTPRPLEAEETFPPFWEDPEGGGHDGFISLPCLLVWKKREIQTLFKDFKPENQTSQAQKWYWIDKLGVACLKYQLECIFVVTWLFQTWPNGDGTDPRHVSN